MQTTLRIRGHDDDVNAVAFLDDSSNLIASGSDDTLIKVTSSFCIASHHISCLLSVWPLLDRLYCNYGGEQGQSCRSAMHVSLAHRVGIHERRSIAHSRLERRYFVE